jgi:hypothetical protein
MKAMVHQRGEFDAETVVQNRGSAPEIAGDVHR